MLMEKEKEKPKEKRDEELEIAKAVEKAQDIIRKNVGNLIAHQFRLESVKQNGTKTKYIVICSVIPDIGEERDYYFIKIDIDTGKLVLPMGQGKLIDGKIRFVEGDIKPEWLE